MKSVHYTPEIAAAIIERIAAGESLRKICAEEGMPSFRAVMNWADEDRDGFRGKYAFAMDLRAQWIFDDMLEIADAIPDKAVGAPGTGEATAKVQAEKLRLETRKWLLSRMAPKRYGDKITQEISGPDGQPIHTTNTYGISPEDEAMIRKISETRMQLLKERIEQATDIAATVQPPASFLGQEYDPS